MTAFAIPRQVWKAIPTGWTISLVLHAIVLSLLMCFVGTSPHTPPPRLTSIDPCQIQAVWTMPLPAPVLQNHELVLQPQSSVENALNEEVPQVDTPVEFHPVTEDPPLPEASPSQIEQLFVSERFERSVASDFFQGPQAKDPEESKREEAKPASGSLAPDESSTEKPTTSSASLAAQMPSPVTDPTLLERIPPEYPRSARRAGIEGDVRLNLNIDGQGTVVSVAVCGGSGSTLLDDTAVAATRQWRFSSSETATAAAVVVTISFRLQQ